MARRIARLPRMWQICCQCALRPAVEIELPRYLSAGRDAWISQYCCARAATLTRRRWSRCTAYSSRASRSVAATEPWVGRTQAVGHRVTPLVRMNSATAASQSFSGRLCHNLSLIIVGLVAVQFVSRIGLAQRYLVTNLLATTASIRGVSSSNNALLLFGLLHIVPAARQPVDSSGKVRRDILARRRYVLGGQNPPGPLESRLIAADAYSLRLSCPNEELDRFSIGYRLTRRHPALVWNVEFYEAIQQYLHRIGMVLSIDIDIDPRCSYIIEYFGYLRTLGIPIARLQDVYELVGVLICLDIFRDARNDHPASTELPQGRREFIGIICRYRANLPDCFKLSDVILENF